MKGKKVLVTGAAGFIGSHLVEQLARAGAEVNALVHYNAGREIGNLKSLDNDVLEQVKIHFGDISDAEYIQTLVEGVEIVFHLAALIAIPYSYIAPRSYLNMNIQGTLNVLEACRRHGVARLLHTSTSEVYGTAQYVPIDERHPLQGQSPYSASKIGADKLAESYYRSFDLPVVTVRPFNTYGPRQSARAFIPTVIAQALKGSTIKLGATSPVRDLTFVSDTAAGFIAAARTPALEGGTFNLGVGEGHSVGDVAKMILKIMGVNGEIVSDEQRLRPAKSEVEVLVSDNTLFSSLSGWKPETDLQRGLEQTIDYFRAAGGDREALSYVV